MSAISAGAKWILANRPSLNSRDFLVTTFEFTGQPSHSDRPKQVGGIQLNILRFAQNQQQSRPIECNFCYWMERVVRRAFESNQ